MFSLVSAGLALETQRLTGGSTTQLYIDLSLIPYRSLYSTTNSSSLLLYVPLCFCNSTFQVSLYEDGICIMHNSSK